MAVTGTTPTEATTVDIGTAGITAAAIMAPVIIPTTRRFSLDCRSRFPSPSLSGIMVRGQEHLTRKFCNS